MNFLTELKRRNVVRMAGLYLVGAWLLVQVAGTLLPVFDAPAWVMKTLVAVLATGLVPALIFSWVFELTPAGLKRDEDVRPEESIAPQTGRRMDRMIIAVLLLALAYFCFDKFVLTPRREVAMVTAASLPNGQRPEINEKSIAVLPFENLSEEKANAFFASGIQDEILTRLAKIGDLKVISRTSTARYQSKPESLTLIAQQLGVANILEGSVQKAGEAVHINVQLIKAATDAHLWAESYDRELKNIFGVEGEVAGAIAEALKAKITGSEKQAISEKPTENVAAYNAFLRGLSIEQTHWSYPAWQEAAAAFAEAVQFDPKFALAWAHLTAARSLLYFNGTDLAGSSAAKVKEAADQAITLQPGLGEAWLAQGDYRYRVLRDFSGALQAYDEAGKRLPNNSLVSFSVANVERRLGHWPDAEAHYRKAAELDPRNLQIFEAMGAFFDFLRRYDEAQATYDLALGIAPDEEDIPARKANVYRNAGRLEEADKELARIPVDSTNAVVRDVRITQATYERRFNDGITVITKILNELKPGELPDAAAKAGMVQLGYLREWTGRPDEARNAFAQAIEAIKPIPDSSLPADGSGLPNLLAAAYAGLGEKEKALAQAHQAVEQYHDDALAAPGAETTLAQIQARFGDLDSALAALPHLLKVPAGLSPADLRYDPMWDPLRNDPRFQAVLARYSAAGRDAPR